MGILSTSSVSFSDFCFPFVPKLYSSLFLALWRCTVVLCSLLVFSSTAGARLTNRHIMWIGAQPVRRRPWGPVLCSQTVRKRRKNLARSLDKSKLMEKTGEGHAGRVLGWYIDGAKWHTRALTDVENIALHVLKKKNNNETQTLWRCNLISGCKFNSALCPFIKTHNPNSITMTVAVQIYLVGIPLAFLDFLLNQAHSGQTWKYNIIKITTTERKKNYG